MSECIRRCLAGKAGQICMAVSAVSALGLFWEPSKIMVLLLAAGLFLVLYQYQNTERNYPWSLPAFLLAVLFSVTGGLQLTFTLRKLSDNTGLTCFAASAMAVAGFYAFYVVSCWIERETAALLGETPGAKTPVPAVNYLLPLSVGALFRMERVLNGTLLLVIFMAMTAALMVAKHCPDLWNWSRQQPRDLKLLSILNTLGILIYQDRRAGTIRFAVAAILSIPFVYLSVLAFYAYLRRVFARKKLFADLSKGEWILYTVLFLVLMAVITVVFLQTDAFYGTQEPFDVIYSSDSPAIVRENAYLNLRHIENDLRQPLFSVFAAPFMGFFWLVGSFLPNKLVLRPLLMNYTQIFLLLISNLILANALELKGRKRMVFIALVSFSYPVLLFSFIMEQYVVAYFYLMLSVLLLKEKDGKPALYGAAGTLLTGAVLFPIHGAGGREKGFRHWMLQITELCLGFLLFLLLFGRLDIILNLEDGIQTIEGFSQGPVPMLGRLQQYSEFLTSCILAPDAEVNLVKTGHPSWLLRTPGAISAGGVLIFGAALFSAFWNREKKACRTAGIWLLFSLFMLCVLGWGSRENGMVLYTLYFGWAVWVLLFALMDRVERYVPHFSVVAGTLGVLALAAINLPAIYQVILFALQYYPI